MTTQQINDILRNSLPQDERERIVREIGRRFLDAQLYGSPDTTCCDCPREPVACTPIEGIKPYDTP
jgi:hypothetical protein